MHDPLEERIVGALRQRQLLKPRQHRQGLLRIAAGLALFVGGVATGRVTLSGAEVAPSAGFAHTPDLEIQATGSAYIAALSRLGQVAEPSVRSRGQEVATASLTGIADELERLDPSWAVLASAVRAAQPESSSTAPTTSSEE